uniref:Uncharacterized protein n=1 Tax=Solanum tuberosum TaxID=4113 RepID=M1DGJ7_SOLTU
MEQVWNPRQEQQKDRMVKIANKFGTLDDNNDTEVGEGNTWGNDLKLGENTIGDKQPYEEQPSNIRQKEDETTGEHSELQKIEARTNKQQYRQDENILTDNQKHGIKLLAAATHIQKKEQHRRHIPATITQQVKQKMNKSHQVVHTAIKGEMKNHLRTQWMEE